MKQGISDSDSLAIYDCSEYLSALNSLLTRAIDVESAFRVVKLYREHKTFFEGLNYLLLMRFLADILDLECCLTSSLKGCCESFTIFV